MSLNEIAQADIEDITSNLNEWGKELRFTAPTGQTATINGLYTEHHITNDPESGRTVNNKNAHCSVSEKFLTDAGYPVRDSNNDVSLKAHSVRVNNSTGLEFHYKIQEAYPDRTVGFIVCILGDAE